MKIKKGDEVKVIAGKDKGKNEGKNTKKKVKSKFYQTQPAPGTRHSKQKAVQASW
jgi:hypothetical protein